ncbi:hypothetical protein SH2C18_25080 [Clostridium sediminicola]|uniref:serine/threonine protein kinase n=1 Tax=Clostridium sediminicola TaxID=3114879 RepID=UPI0031F25D22
MAEHEYDILKKVENSSYFPRVIKFEETCMLREYVKGVLLKKYVKKNGVSNILLMNLIQMIEEFEKLGFWRVNYNTKHIYVQPDESLQVIDPRKCYSMKAPQPTKILKLMDKQNALDRFMKVLISYNPELAVEWFKNN